MLKKEKRLRSKERKEESKERKGIHLYIPFLPVWKTLQFLKILHVNRDEHYIFYVTAYCSTLIAFS